MYVCVCLLVREDIRDKYELGKVLGSGSFGQVREAALKDFPDKVRAVKIIERDDDAEHGGEWSNSAMFRQEVALLQNLKHDNIVRFWDVYEDVHFLYVVMDLCRGGEVFSKILELRRFTEANAATLGSQMLAAIAYIHTKSIMHRDIKAENFLLSDKSPTSVVKMIDFGMAVKFDHGVWFKEICGSPHYLAPELIGQKYNHMVDMWAFGVLMYLLMYGHYPYDSKNTRDIMMKVLTEPIRWQTKAKLSQQTLGFLKRCLEPSVRKRMTAEDGRRAACSPWHPQDLNEFVRSAHRKVTSTRKQVDQEAENRRTDLLEKINKDFEKGIRLGNRLGETPQEDLGSVGSVGGPVVAPKPVEPKKEEKKVVVEDSKAGSKHEPETPAVRRKKGHAHTARLMYLGDLQEKDEDEMRKLWAEWKSKEKAAAEEDGIAAISEEDREMGTGRMDGLRMGSSRRYDGYRKPLTGWSPNVEMLEQRAAEKERALQHEVEILRKQRDTQVASLRAQLEFQTTELKQTSEQEVSLLKQEFERRERSLQQMLEQEGMRPLGTRGGDTDGGNAAGHEVEASRRIAEGLRCQDQVPRRERPAATGSL
eukprot:g30980.t1